jgi:hypothetical protein
MFKSILFSACLGVFTLQAGAQTLTMPPEVQAAYQKGTRSVNGKPGKNYWQNHAKYTITVSMTPPNNLINGEEEIVYTNHSPDALRNLNMKLIANVHAAGRNGKKDEAIQIDDFQANGAKVAWDNATATTTNQLITLDKPLMPNDSVKLKIKWHYMLSKSPGRDGVIDPTTFFLAYFYPRVAVYDDYKGWDTQPHHGDLEFYNDFNDYTLYVSVPKNYIVWSTGTLRNPSMVLQPDAVKRFEASLTSDSTINIATSRDLAGSTITAQNATNTWMWSAKNISDMTVGVSNHYNWDGASVVVDDKANRRVSMQAAYPDASEDFKHSVQFGRNSLRYFSTKWPGVPYPFEKSTAFQGFADMEYPMMINDSHEENLGFAQLVQDHEQAHTYFPFYMGINESRYAFMDEGWATTFEYLIGIEEKGQQAADEFYKQFRVNGWIKSSHDRENPIITPSPEVTYGAGNNAYGKPSLSYLALKDYLGDELFKKALHTYMENWNGKHPIPWDYFNSMSSGSGKDLNWFFYNWFYTPSYIDLELSKVYSSGTNYTLNIKNTGGFAIPFNVNVTYADGTTGTFHQTPAVWEKDQKQTTINVKATKEVKGFTLDGGIFVDATPKNNTTL